MSMEFSEFIKIIKKNSKTFWFIFFGTFIIGILFYFWQTGFYKATIAVNIARSEVDKSQNNQYDQFYRLQADEKFGKNIVNWVKDEGLLKKTEKEISKVENAKWDDISSLKAAQLSSNYIKIEFKSKTSHSAFVFGEILEKNLKIKNNQLNSDEGKNWFELVIDNTNVEKNEINKPVFAVIILCFSILLSSFGVMMKEYFNLPKNENRN